MGRKSKYTEFVEPHIKEVEEWVKQGATDEEVAKALNISLTSLYVYKTKYANFAEAFTHARANVVIEIKEALLKKALGFTYKEEKRAGKKDKDGENIVLVEEYTRYCPPSETAAAMLLRNYDKDWKDTDEATARLKKQAPSLKEAIAAASNFDLKISEDN